MARLSQTQIDNIATRLGYRGFDMVDKPLIDLEYTEDAISRIEGILTDLDSIDALLREARSHSMDNKIESLDFNYPAHVAHLKSEGSRLVHELSMLTQTKIRHNTYRCSQRRSWIG